MEHANVKVNVPVVEILRLDRETIQMQTLVPRYIVYLGSKTFEPLPNMPILYSVESSDTYIVAAT
jgi:hypothetical protein